MKLFKIGLISLLFVAPILAQEQAQVPPDVNYKPAAEPVNEAAKAQLQRSLAGEKESSKQLLSDSVTCGPMLWHKMSPTADKTMINAKKIVAVIGVPTPHATEGRTFVTDQEKQSFWKQLFEKYPELANGKIRKARAYEIGYYWATVPFEYIQEPFFAIEAGNEVFIANLRINFDKPVLFWIDRVGNFEELQTSQASAK